MNAFGGRAATPRNSGNGRIGTQCWKRIVGGRRHRRAAHLGWTTLRHPLLHRICLLLVHDIRRVHVPSIPHLLLHHHHLPLLLLLLLLVHIHSVHIARHLGREIRACHTRVYTRCAVNLITERVHPTLRRLGAHLLGLRHDW